MEDGKFFVRLREKSVVGAERAIVGNASDGKEVEEEEANFGGIMER